MTPRARERARRVMSARLVGSLVMVAVLGRDAVAGPTCRPAAAVTVTCDRTGCVADRDAPPGAGVVVHVIGAGFRLRAPRPGRAPVLVRDGARLCPWPGLEALEVVPPRGFTLAVRSADDLDDGPLRMTVTGGTAVPRIVDGTPVAADRFTDVVAIHAASGALCTGVVVGPRQVLTAAHCGEVATVEVTGAPAPRAVARRVAPGGADAALVTVDTELGVPVRARSRDPGDQPADGRVHVVGFGADDPTGRRGAAVKNEGETVATDWACDGHRRDRFACRPGVEVLVAAGSSDSCRGDSGGPIFDRVDGRWRLIGVTSRGLPGARATCGGGGIYVHVGALAAWLDQELTPP